MSTMEAEMPLRPVEDPKSLQPWMILNPGFSCRPDDIRRYMDHGRWDLVFNAIVYLAGAVDEGSA
jgi:hypothetical protein